MDKKTFRTLLKLYLCTWGVFFLFYYIGIWRANISFEQSIETLGTFVPSKGFLFLFHIFFLLVYVLFISIRYAVRGFKKKGWSLALKRFSFSLVIPIFVIYISIKGMISLNSAEFFNYTWDYSIENTSQKATNLYAIDGKHRGMSVFWSYDKEDVQKATKDIIKDNIEWVTVIPFIDQQDETTNRIGGTVTPGVWSRRDSVTMKHISRLQERDIRVHLKPHIWLRDGWRSNIELSQEDWEIWFKSYEERMLQYARIATKMEVPLFCIGTELRTAIQHQPEAWLPFIKEIKKIYSGKLTYASNWDDPIEDIPFWKELDYIGVQAYFPLTTQEEPDLETIKAGWDAHITALKNASEQYEMPILFTEIGYRSDATATIAPWEWGALTGALTQKKSDKTQQLAYEAMFQKLWDEPWFAGCYIWQWHTRTTAKGASTNVDFTPRFKPAENTITKWYGAVGEVTVNSNK
ncbi:hypothetical protein [uncultured Dokdonia sp.]|uniref:glycoside hydrolase family 113 n=1 Tax=uncultured Dokdonia sp. TaxID=575653 RepID=UPI00261C7A33|nr:hypothetical protein [uncultured Dokdonia sp.]